MAFTAVGPGVHPSWLTGLVDFCKDFCSCKVVPGPYSNPNPNPILTQQWAVI